jgi:hypothetical protein
MSHSKKEVREAIEYAKSKGWRVVEGGSHAWGQMYCPNNDKDCRCGDFCRVSIASTPKNPGNHAKKLKQIVDNCIYEKSSVNDDISE